MGSHIIKPPGIGPWCFKIQGHVYHFASPLHPKPNSERQFAQLYILDKQLALDQRMAHVANASCVSNTMQLLLEMMNDVNPFAKAYQMLHDVELDELRKAQLTGIF